MENYILVVGEDPALLKPIVEQLSTSFSLQVASDQSALDVARQNPPELILLTNRQLHTDTNLMLSLLRDDPVTGNIPVIVCSEHIGKANQGSSSAPAVVSASGQAQQDNNLNDVNADTNSILHSVSVLLSQMEVREIILTDQNDPPPPQNELPYQLLFQHMLSGATYCKMIFENGEPTDFVYLDINPTFEKMSGLHDVLGKPVTTVVPGIFEHDPELLEIHGRVASTGKPAHFENYAASMKRWFSSSVYCPHPGHFVCIFDDITKQKETQQRLAFQAQLLNNITDAVIVTDTNYVITYWNAAAEQTYGWSEQEAIGRKSFELFNPEYEGITQAELFTQLKTSGNVKWEGTHSCKDGTKVNIEGHAISIFDATGKINGYAGAYRNITEHIQSQSLIKHLAYFDALTELPNRSLFSDRLNQAIALAQRTKRFGAVVFIDLDQFKKVNDIYGHDVGDALLKQAAKRQVEALRESDTVARFGGDEFVILLTELGSDAVEAASLATAIVEKLRASLELPYQIGARLCSTTASIGISMFPKHKKSAQDTIREADIAMYKAKGNGRNSLVFFEDEMQKVINDRFAIEEALRNGIQNETLELYLQSQLNRSGNVIGAEALVRWRHPTLGYISPEVFIPLAEEVGLINKIGEWVFRESCQTLVRLNSQRPELSIAINVSPKQFYDVNFVKSTTDILTQTGANPCRITLEVTENLLFERTSEVMSTMRELAELGFKFSIDDFGTGYSSMSYLKSLPLSELKIDKSFVRDIPEDPNDVALVETILSIAHHFGLNVVAEGVETQSHFESLLGYDCDLFQGYLFHKPEPASQWVARMIHQSAK